MGPERWLAAASPHGGLDYLCDGGPGLSFHRTRAGRRKFRLFACGCARRVWDLIPDGPCREAVGLAERLDDGEPVADRVAALPDRDRTGPLSGRHAADAAMACVNSNIRYAIAVAAQAAARAVAWARVEARDDHRHYDQDEDEEERAQVPLLVDVFEDVFRPVEVDPRWRTGTVVSLAGGIYNDRTFDRMPILGDALMDAGCDHPGVLDHCRHPGPHGRGCWVIDLALGMGHTGRRRGPGRT